MDLSIILTAHSEGILVHKTLQSIYRALDVLDAEKISYELIIHTDSASPETSAYFNRIAKNKALVKERHMRFFTNNFGDAGLSRNFCVQEAKGEYLATLDADDLISKNYLADAIKMLRVSDKKLICYPEYCVTFKTSEATFFNFWHMYDSHDDLRQDAFSLLDSNKWISATVAHRSVYLDTPYIESGKGYGHEDFVFNVMTLYKGHPHRIVPGAIYFYRKKAVSVNSWANENMATEPYSPLFDYSNFYYDEREAKEANREGEQLKLKDRAEQKLISTYKRARNNRYLNAVITPAANIAKRVLMYNPARGPWKTLPKELRHEWIDLSEIETNLYPVRYKTAGMTYYTPEKFHALASAYAKIVNHQPEQADYVFLVPWVRIGGADKVLLNYLEAFKEIHPDKKIAVISTIPAKNTWATHMPKNSFLLDFGNNIVELCDAQRMDLLTKLIIQLRPKTIHIVNSEYAYLWAEHHKELIRNNFKLNLSLFCYDIIPDTKQRGRFDYADPYAVSVYDIVDRIFTDNCNTVNRLVEHEGFEKEKIFVEHQPANMVKVGKKTNQLKSDHKKHVLWASRVCAQKNPEILSEIAKYLDDDIVIDVYGAMENGYTTKVFNNAPNIHYHGGFNGISSLNPQNYDAFLYTSLIDGLPNILLEIAQFAIPIVTANAGGAADFIVDEETGLLVEDAMDAAAYAEKLNRLLRDGVYAKKLCEQAKQKLEEQHTWDSYLETIKRDFGKEL